MVKMSRSERKAYNAGKREGREIGWLEGYAKGLYDGNPFNKMLEAISSMVKAIQDNPELMAEAMKQRAAGIEAELEAEEENEID